jgi:stage II sporulation protein D
MKNAENKKAGSAGRFIRLSARLGVGLCLIILVFSCAAVPGLKDESPGGYIRLPFVRVLLDDAQSSATVGAEGSYAIECLFEGKQTVYYSGRPAEISQKNGLLDVKNARGGVIHTGLNEVNIIPRGAKNRTLFNKVPYRGLLKILPYGNNVRIINVLYMEDYLRGVVPPEIGKRADSEVEAVKAQAVAARTYAMAHLRQYSGQPFDMKASIIDQVYEGAESENRLINKAIDATAGSVIFYQDDFINAYYHSTCGGTTDDIDHVWDRRGLPYLKAVADSGACSWSKYYTWREYFTEKQLRGRVEQYLSSDRGRDFKISRIKSVEIKERTPGGRVARLIIRTESDAYTFKKDRIRWVLGRTSNPDLILPSDRFDINVDLDGAGFLTGIAFKGRGYGHGVGMCQCGAIGLARDGRTYEGILKHYYSNVELKKLY